MLAKHNGVDGFIETQGETAVCRENEPGYRVLFAQGCVNVYLSFGQTMAASRVCFTCTHAQ